MVGFSGNSKIEPTVGVKFFSAGLAASFADCITFPLDTSKVRLQLQGEGVKAPIAHKFGNTAVHAAQKFKYHGIVGTIRTVSKEEGVRALYNGLCAGLQRQMAFASVRIGLYDSVKTLYIGFFSKGNNTGQNLFLRVAAGITTGGMAVVVAQPTDVVKVRMQADTKIGHARRYSGAIDAYRTIAKKEGVRGLWKGAGPNVMRNATVNATELVTYDLVKTTILTNQLMTDNVPCHFLSAFITGFITTLTASPIDVVKTRFMNSHQGQYGGVADCANKMFREGGVTAFYKGFMPSFVRLGSWNIVMFVTYEQLKRFMMEMSQAKSHPASSGVNFQKL